MPTERELDRTDWRILAELQADGRLSFNQLGKRINLSAPAVAERVRRLEEAGVITGYQAKVDAAAVGQPVTVFVLMHCQVHKCLLRTTKSEDFPEIVEIHKLSGEHCTMLKARLTSIDHTEGFIDRLGQHGDATTHLVLSTQYDSRPVEEAASDVTGAPQSEGWTN